MVGQNGREWAVGILAADAADFELAATNWKVEIYVLIQQPSRLDDRLVFWTRYLFAVVSFCVGNKHASVCVVSARPVLCLCVRRQRQIVTELKFVI